jgi:protein-disulfide isomerase
MRLPLLALLALLPGLAAAAPLTRADVEAIVHDYLTTHGDEVIAAAHNYQQKQQAAAAAASIRATTPTRGPATAPITIIEFADFECPYCLSVEPTIETLQKRYGNRIRWAFKFLPLEFHRNAMPAAQAAAAAAKQGKFWEFAEQIFAHQDALGDKLYLDTARSLKLDLAKFNTDRDSAAVKAIIIQDLADAAAVGARGTPYFLINGQGNSGAMPAENFTTIIEGELKKAAPRGR